MTDTLAWICALITVLVMLGYEAGLWLMQRRNPGRVARFAHVSLREDWFNTLSEHPGTEVLAVQTLRNSVMSATMTASTAVLGLIGSVTLAAPGLSTVPHFTVRVALELLLMATLFASLVSSAMSIRYYNHAGFIASMPPGSEARKRWAAPALLYLRRAGLLYSWGLRHLILVAPLLASIVHPLAGPVSAVLLVPVLLRFDRFGS
ncbi:MAG: DUF599 domain-containing protein [Pseudomonadota bacterium]